MTIASITTATLGVDAAPRFQSDKTLEAPNPKRFVISKSSTTESDGTRTITILYSDKTTETKTERPIKASVNLTLVPGTGGILV